MASAIATSTIVQQAFTFMEVTPPSSFEDDTEKGAAAAIHYPLALRACLEAGDWSFASRLARLPLAQDPAAVVDADLPNIFVLPADFLVLRRMVPADAMFRVDDRYLRCDHAEDVQLRYTALLDDETKLPATFQIAVALQLAVLMGSRFLRTASKLKALKSDLGQALMQVGRFDARSASMQSYRGDGHRGGDWAREARR